MFTIIIKNLIIVKEEWIMLCDLICNAQKGDKEAMLELIQKFSPLFRKYARKLNYEDAYEDIILFYMEMIRSVNLERIVSLEDGAVISYINVSIINYYNKRVRQIIRCEKEVALSDLTEEQKYYVEARAAKLNQTDFFAELGIKSLLSEKEYQIIYQIYEEGYTAAEIARISQQSRQSVNQLKQRALKKIADFLKKYSG